MDPVARFADLMAEPGAAVGGDGGPPLDLSLALIAAAGRPGVDPEGLVAELDTLAAAVEDPHGSAVELCAALFGPVGFAGDTDDYYDPRNSLLDEVLQRRRGIPITLSVLAMEVGRRRGVELVGVGMPGHFLVRDAHGPTFFDPFGSGRRLDAPGCRDVFVALHGPGTPFDAGYLAPTPASAIVVRVLNNLVAARTRAGDRAGLATALRLQVALPGTGAGERRRLAGVLAAEGRFLDAAALHEELVELEPTRAEEHRVQAARLRARLN
ncbi:MAG: SirB1 family protein [Microthrixaceae bacterium]